jgi:hypothetical protein
MCPHPAPATEKALETGLFVAQRGIAGRVTFDLPQGATTTTVSVDLRLLSQGPGKDIFLNSLYHLTVTPNGNVTAEVDTFEVFCQ